jgi:CxxC motif-containing protein (DUF1111 family)
MKLAAWLVMLLPLAVQAGKDSFAVPYEFLTRESRRAFFTGNAFFNENWVTAPASAAARDGLGPLFQARSCSACHRLDGRGLPPQGPDDPFLGLVVRVGPSQNGHPAYGGQLSPLAVPGAQPEPMPRLTWHEQDGLRSPQLQFVENTPLSLRLAPAVFGGGLLEAIPEATLRAWADPEDLDHDGISGRVNQLADGRIGRFGWKASVADLADQTASAFLHDMGLRTSRLPSGDLTPEQEKSLAALPNGGSPEVSDQISARIVSYLQALAPPNATAEQPAGKKLFSALNCQRCHLPEAKTGAVAGLPELANRTFHAYTDLLLHDMGTALADGRPDHAATGQEWRTPPLWGLGRHERVSGSVAYLHDGRARTLDEAIRWHGGEAAPASQAYQQLTANQKAELMAFLQSL